ncbi:MAG TPA: hypothetical protein VFG30_36755 [Polyangiales bacterium]|nr:hypothetical protein [Polyangiales bacterium]
MKSQSVAIANEGPPRTELGARSFGGAWPSVLVLFSAICLCIRTVIVLQRWSGYEIGKYFFADDAFYYFKIAQNVVLGRGSTFDGSSATNGYHPLWELCCIGFHAIWPGSSAGMVSLVFVVQTVLLLAATWLLYRGLAPRNVWAAALSALLLMLNTVTSLVLIDGMESGLAFALLCALTYLAATRGDRFFDLRESRYSIAIAALLVGLALTRLEASLFAATFISIALARGVRERGAQLGNSLVVAAALGGTALAYVAVNFAIVGLPVPVSGLVKELLPASPGAIQRVSEAQFAWFVSPLRLQKVFENKLISAALFVALLYGLGAFVRDAWQRRHFGLVLVVANCVILIAYNLFSIRQAFHWYGWPALLLGTLGTFGLLTRLLNGLSGWRGRSVFASVFVLAVAYGAGTTYRVATRDYDQLYDWASSPVLMDTARHFIEHEVPPDAQLAGDSVGLLSYLGGRDILNVEGLVGDRAYYQALKRGDSRNLLRERGVSWLVTTLRDDYALPCARAESWDLADEARQVTSEPIAGNVHVYRLDYSGCPANILLSTPGQKR